MTAYAQTATGQEATQQIISLVVILVVFFAVFYFLLIRPQRRRQREHLALLSSLKRGDRVITAGGIIGTIEDIDENEVVLAVEEGKLRVSKTSIVEKVKK
ncbi:MAG: preprotein translocase subunit YajC [Candidatus Bipolaricaulota bacterium]|nr:preprotein translocase subunit YajC [Candidatus Bipolaricaulota bacterium]MCX7844615.1 preprotein translocase subunit YajC [Candidatus Bipolaricaulota bacterium]MDW8152118.1 preprotein translocase subunit YajC [Candidatus Bipolaricaulota bacterium]